MGRNGVLPTVRKDTEEAQFTYMQDSMKSTFLLSFGKRGGTIADRTLSNRAPVKYPARCRVGLNYWSAAMVPVRRTARPTLLRSVTWPWL